MAYASSTYVKEILIASLPLPPLFFLSPSWGGTVGGTVGRQAGAARRGGTPGRHAGAA